MAKQYDGQDPSFKAYDNMSSSQYLFVKMNGDDTVDVCGAITDVIVGVLQTEGTAGQAVDVRIDGHSKIIFGETVTAGQLLSTDAAGKAISITAGGDTTTYVAGICTKGGDADDVGEMILQSRGRGA